jgi:hypothetical protein
MIAANVNHVVFTNSFSNMVTFMTVVSFNKFSQLFVAILKFFYDLVPV